MPCSTLAEYAAGRIPDSARWLDALARHRDRGPLRLLRADAADDSDEAPSAGASASIDVGGSAIAARVGGFKAVPRLIDMLGGDARVLIGGAGLACDALDNADQRVPIAVLARLFATAAAATRTPCFGLLAGRAWHGDDFGAIGACARHSATLGQALETIARLELRHSPGPVPYLLRHGGVADFGYAIDRACLPGLHQVFDALLAAAANLIRDLVGNWNPCAVLLAYDPPSDLRHHCNLFRVKPVFNSEYCALRFAERWLDVPLREADVELRRQAQDKLTPVSVGVAEQVRRAIRIALFEGESSGDCVAAALGMHRRTMNRRLAEQDTTFQACLDEQRYDVACQLLAESRLSLDDVAAALAYSSLSSFMRSFRRWSGCTPSAWRRAAARQGAASMLEAGFQRPAPGGRSLRGTAGACRCDTADHDGSLCSWPAGIDALREAGVAA